MCDHEREKKRRGRRELEGGEKGKGREFKLKERRERGERGEKV